ncbi:MAG: protein kinase [Chloroflexaceae bacterium]|nr:protein kinase [Chloroflexaceae bacterium]
MQKKLLNGRYEIEEKVGEGGMATVYRGRDWRLNRQVAIKVLHLQYVNDPDFLSRFQHEAQAAAILSHPNIVNVYDVGQDGDQHYIVMEFVDGTNLKTLIQREGPVNPDRAVVIAQEVAFGLEAAHRFGLVHRDIKSQNIIVSPTGDVKITDFGIAKSHLSTALTQTGVTFGTADYISPEQAQGQTATPQSDLYSLGVTLYEMLTGRLPFTGESTVAIAMQHVNTEPPPVRQYAPQVPAQLEALVLRSMAKDPSKRPGTVREFAELLQRYHHIAEQPTVVAPQPSQRTRNPTPQRLSTPATNENSTTGRMVIPPPPSAVQRRAPRQQNHGCGAFMVGLVVLVGVLSLVILFNTGGFNDGISARPPATSTLPPIASSTAVSTPSNTPAPTITAIPSQTSTTEPTVLPTSLPFPTPAPLPTPTPVPLATVPGVVGLTEEQAIDALTSAGLEPVQSEPQYNDAVAAGVIIAQDPPPDTTLQQGNTVAYVVSLGPELVTVPNLINTSLAFAQNEAESLGLVVEVQQVAGPANTEGFVIAQTPAANLRVEPGHILVLSVSIGDKVRFPDIIGLQLWEAEQRLNNTDGLSLVYVDPQGRDRLGAQFDTFQPNQVISALANEQPVNNGDFVPRGSGIVLGVRAP